MPVFPIREIIDEAGFFRLPASDLHHLRRVLRVKEGDSFAVVHPDGREGRAILRKKGKDYFGQTSGQTNLSEGDASTLLPLTLGVGLIRWPRMEWLVEKASELGVARLVPLTLNQGSRGSDAVSPAKIARLRKISQETLKQCARPQGPAIENPQALPDFLAACAQPLHKICLDESAQGPHLLEYLQGENPKAPFCFLIGPEGGFSPKEREKISGKNFQTVTLGAIKFRTETAAIYGASLLDAFLQGQGGRR